jgi:hypothetical protein
VRVTNEWDQAIPRFSLSTDYHYDAPQPEQMGTVPAQVFEGNDSIFSPMGPTMGGDLGPRMTLSFYLDPRVIDALRSRAASLSTDSHWIALRTDGYEFDRVPGKVVAEFLEREE